MSLIWTNSTKSGLCDRLIDLFIISSIAKLYNKELYLVWEEQPINDVQRLIWNNIRFDDYKIENVIEYFNFPSLIHFISHKDINEKLNNKNSDDIIFDIYLGGVYSPFTFYDIFIDKKYDKFIFINIFKDLINKFKPKQKLLNLVKDIPENLISVHLRRTDKSSELVNSIDANGIDIKYMEDLNNETNNLINRFIEKNYKNYYFCSDCPNTKKEYENNFINTNIINYNINTPIEQTYIDIYLMSISKYIIFSSMINNSKLIYFYEDSIIHKNYTDFDNICFKNKFFI